MPMLDATDVADLSDIFTTAQTPLSLVLYRYNDATALWDAQTAQSVQVALAGRQPNTSDVPGTATLQAPLTFYKDAPFNVTVGDTFAYEGRHDHASL